jgi:hypothetical protein
MATPLWKKLGYKAHFQVLIVNEPKSYFEWVQPLPEGVKFGGPRDLDLIHFFTNSVQELEEGLLSLQKLIKQNGMIWVSWYKKASKLSTEINEDVIRDTSIAIGLVDVKVCSINEHWSALKMVIPVKLRK